MIFVLWICGAAALILGSFWERFWVNLFIIYVVIVGSFIPRLVWASTVIRITSRAYRGIWIRFTFTTIYLIAIYASSQESQVESSSAELTSLSIVQSCILEFFTCGVSSNVLSG